MISRVNVHRRNRRNLQISQATIPMSVSAVNSVASMKWKLVFDSPVSAVSLPLDFSVNGAPPIGVTVVDPLTVELDFTTPVATGQDWIIPPNSPYIRTMRGGTVAAAAGTF